MRTQFQCSLIRGVIIVGLLTLFIGCAFFKGKPAESTIIKPQPIGGYEELSTRIHYPLSAREQGTEGSVMIKAFVTREGSVSEAQVTQKLDPELDRIAANAVKRTLFEPALRDGEPVDVWISIPIIFALKNWYLKTSPFSVFEMVVEPSPAYKSFEVNIQGEIKSNTELPLRIELLLPLNADKPRVKVGSEAIGTATVHDENGEWLIFQIEEPLFNVGFNYRPFIEQGDSKFQYKFALNQALPDWKLMVIYGDQKVNFTQEPNNITELASGILQFSYDLKALEAYEFRYLEVGIDK